MEDACYVSEHSEVNAQEKKMTLKSKNVSRSSSQEKRKHVGIKQRCYAGLQLTEGLCASFLQLTFSGVAQLEEHMEYVPHPSDPNKWEIFINLLLGAIHSQSAGKRNDRNRFCAYRG